MPTAKCKDCGYLLWYPNKRGTRLKNMKCPLCGGQLKRAVYGKDIKCNQFKIVYKRDRGF